MPIPFLGYLRQEHLPPRSRKIMLGMEFAFLLMAVVATVLTFLPGKSSFLTLVPFLRVVILLALAVSMFLIILARG